MLRFFDLPLVENCQRTRQGGGLYAVFGVITVKPEHVHAFREATIRRDDAAAGEH